MEKVYGEYIRRIEIEAMWGKKHIVWNLHPEVNILSGVNGVGKSTILDQAVTRLNWVMEGEVGANPISGVNIQFYPETANCVRYDVIRSIDRPLMGGTLLEKMSDKEVITELDWQLYKLQRSYLDYQVNIANRTIEILSSESEDKMARVAETTRKKTEFLDYMDDMFAPTGKRIRRNCNEILFDLDGEEISPYRLSSGEKQLLVIFLTTLVQDNRPTVLFMDEPEISLHIEWQQKLICSVRKMNPNAQIILTTHSPALIMDGWMDSVMEVDAITVK